jgi:hypothetical protein
VAVGVECGSVLKVIRGEAEARSRSTAAIGVLVAAVTLWLWLPASAPARALAPVAPGPATHFAIAAPAPATLGSPFTFTVTAADLYGNTTPAYTGTVHFTSSDGAATLPADATLTNGTGTFSATFGTVGNQTISVADTTTASINGNSNAVAVSATTTTMSSGPPVATFSSGQQAVPLVATITSNGGPVNAGTVTFTVLNGTIPVGPPVTSTIVTPGSALAVYLLPAGTAVGTYTVQASYSGGGPFLASSDSTEALVIQAAPTTTTASSSSTWFSGSAHAVFLSATVAPPAGTVDEGTITFTVMQGSTVVGSPTTSSTVANGNANVLYALPAGLSAGSYTIRAVYNPGADFVASQDTAHTLTIYPGPTRTVVPDATTVYSVAAQTVTLSATVTSGTPVNVARAVVPGAGPVNEGTVTFTVFAGQVLIGSATTSATVTGGNASVEYPLPGGTNAGPYSIRAVYNPGPDFTRSSVREGPTLTVARAPTTTAAADTSVAFSTAAQNVPLSAKVTSPAGTVGEGIVTFTVLKGAATIGSATTSDTVIGGNASVSYPLPAGTTPGSYAVQATYSPSVDFTASADSTHTLSVIAAPSASITSPADGSTFTFAQAVSASYTCADANGGPGIASCTGPVANGAVVDTSHPGSFSFTVTATSKDGQSATKTAGYAVLKAPTVLNAQPLTVSQTPAAAKDRRARAKAHPATTALTGKVAATLTRPDTGAGVPGETIHFTDPQGGSLCQATTDASGAASCTFTLTPGLAQALARGYGVSFAGDADYLPASTTVAPGTHSPKLATTKVSVSPLRAHRCQAELNGRARASRVLCDQLWVTLTGTADQTAGGLVTVSMTGGWSTLLVRTAGTTATITGGRWQARLLVYGRNHEPGDRWTIKIAYPGDGTHGAATTSRQVMIEAEGPGNPAREPS